jgi:Amt family ammonium transporter
MAAASVGGARPYWYRESAGRELGERAAIRARLRDGDPGALLEMRYQPVFDAGTGAPYAASAVAVWVDPGMRAAAPPAAYLGADPDRAAREAFERWTIASAADAHRTWRAAGLDLRVHLGLANPSDAVIDAIATGFGSDDAMRALLAEIVVDDESRPDVLESFARRLHALGARVGVAAWRTSSAPFDGTHGLLDFVTVDGTHDVRTLAELALASVVAPMVLASGANDRERARWLARHGASALRGEGLAAPLCLHELVRWASDRRGSLGL